MEDTAAKELAAAIGGEVWQSGGGIHLVVLKRPDGTLVVFSDDLVAEYADEEAFEKSSPTTSILLREGPEEYWVIEDAKGDVWLEDPKHGRGWAIEEDAQHEARGIQSRTGLRTFVRPQRLDDAVKEPERPI